MSERYDTYTLVKCGSSEEESIKKLVSFLNRSFLKKDTALQYLQVYDELTQQKSSKFVVLCEDNVEESSYTFVSEYHNDSIRHSERDAIKAAFNLGMLMS